MRNNRIVGKKLVGRYDFFRKIKLTNLFFLTGVGVIQALPAVNDRVEKSSDVLAADEMKIAVTANKIPDAFAMPQQDRITVKGVVKDESGVTLPGVAIQVKGSTRGVTTDLDGSFSIDVKPSDVLIFTYLGMQDQPIEVKGQKTLNVIMKAQVDELEEVEVVAFAKQKKESVISSISTVKPTELKMPSSNLTTSFAGRIAGVIAYQRSGEPGQDNAEFFVRGVTSFGTGKVDPLILIDGVELTSYDLARLTPDDIASFSILKDAAATALYGARGANGVIMVTTKEGREGKLQVQFRVENSLSMNSSETELADPITFMKLHNEAVRTRNPLGILPYMDSEIAAREAGKNPYVYPVVDWKDMLLQNHTMNQRGNLSLSGGGKVARYYVALSYARDNGLLKSDPMNNFDSNINLNKYTVRTNVNMNLTKTTELAVRVSGSFDDYSGPLSGGADMYNKAVRANPVLFPAVYAPDKKHEYVNHLMFGNYGDNGEYMNPYAELVKGYKESQETHVVAQLELNQNLEMITEGLNFRIKGHVTRNSAYDTSRSFTPFYYSVGGYDKLTDVYTLTPLNETSGTDYLAYKEGGKKVDGALYLEAALSYDRTFNDDHNVSGLLVYTAQENKTGNAGSLELSLPGRNLGLAGRFTYGYKEKYFGEFNFGYNGSERFDRSHRWGFFPSGGIGWMISNEDFWKNWGISKYVNTLKVRATYGLVGNDQIDREDINRFFYLSQVNMDDGGKGYNFGYEFGEHSNGVSIGRYANPDIGWEIAHKLNLGLETKLFNSLDFNLDVFTEKRENILQERADIPSLIGLQQPQKANIGVAKAHGFEFSIDYQKVFNKDFWLTVRGNYTYATSKYDVYEEPDYTNTPWLSKIGYKTSQQWGLIAERLFVDEEDVKNSPRQTFGEYMAGDIKYKDINEDGVIDEQDRVPIGYPTSPEIIYGFGFSLGYKNFDVSAFFQGSGRSSFWITPRDVAPFLNRTDLTGGGRGNTGVMKFIAEDHWSEANPNPYAMWPRLSDYEIANNQQQSTWWMRNGSFLRLKSAEIGYTLPDKIARKMFMTNFRVYLSGTNLFCLSSFDLWDPEMGGNGLGYPIQRVFNVGLQVGF